MTVLIAVIVYLIVIALLVYGEGLIPFDRRIVQLIQAATVVIGALLILQRVALL